MQSRNPLFGAALALGAASMAGAMIVQVEEPERHRRREPEPEEPKPTPPPSAGPALADESIWPARIVHFPDHRLLERSSPYQGPFGADLQPFVDHMLACLYASGTGVGLSAVQIGVMSRVCVIDVYAKQPSRRSPRVFVNPEILSRGRREIAQREGCLSIPGRFGDVMRAATINATWLDIDGKRQGDDLGGFLAHILQHEIDHMDGMLFTQRAAL